MGRDESGGEGDRKKKENERKIERKREAMSNGLRDGSQCEGGKREGRREEGEGRTKTLRGALDHF